jgi:hypothetical protein
MHSGLAFWAIHLRGKAIHRITTGSINCVRAIWFEFVGSFLSSAERKRETRRCMAPDARHPTGLSVLISLIETNGR